jgi:hypothetical protein
VVERAPSELNEEDLNYSFGDVAGRRLKTGALRMGYLLEGRREGLGERRFSWSQLPLTSFGPGPGFHAAGDVDFRQRQWAAARSACRALRWLTPKESRSGAPIEGRLAVRNPPGGLQKYWGGRLVVVGLHEELQFCRGQD